jgi:NAD(P)H dehydrogenase (quinone)
MPLYTILGAGGKVGSSTASALRKAGMPVRAVLRDKTRSAWLSSIGCEIATADFHDVDSLVRVFQETDTVQVILPLNMKANDPAADMRHAVDCLVNALETSATKRVLLISDYGAHVVDDIGMPSIFHMFEERLSRLSGHKIFLRSAEHMENWARAIPPILASGTLSSFHSPVNRALPMISAHDVGLISADLLMQPTTGNHIQIIHAEGPCRYSDKDVAATLSGLLARTIVTAQAERSQWEEIFGKIVPPSLAQLLIKTNDAHNTGGLIDVQPGSTGIRRGNTELEDVLQALLRS